MDDFYSTSIRMWKDAAVLYNSGCWFNSCYLLGYIIECYGKLVLGVAGYNAKSYSHRINDMDIAITSLISLSVPISKYCINLNLECSTIVNGNQAWNPKHRYKNDLGFWDSDTIVTQFRTEAQKALNSITQMKIDGVI